MFWRPGPGPPMSVDNVWAVSMSLRSVPLRKLLKLFYLEAPQRRSAIRAEIRTDIARAEGQERGGGDFYAPFWFDACSHVFGRSDLHQSVALRIAANQRRRNLYPLLQDGFLLWWNERRRWTNEPYQEGRSFRARFEFPGIDAVVKIDSILSVTDRARDEYAIYPYFSLEPELSDEAARLGLWLLTEALKQAPAQEFRILDVIRGRTYSLDRTVLLGDEEDIFRRRYLDLLREHDDLEREYR
jgi:hypothetical protein